LAKSFCFPASLTRIAIWITPTWPVFGQRRKNLPIGFRKMLAAKAAWSLHRLCAFVAQRRKNAVATGTTTVADIEAVPELLPENVGRHAIAHFFVSRNDRHPFQNADRVTFERSHFKNGFAFASAMRRVAFAARTLFHFAGIAAALRKNCARKTTANHHARR